MSIVSATSSEDSQSVQDDKIALRGRGLSIESSPTRSPEPPDIRVNQRVVSKHGTNSTERQWLDLS